MEAKRKCPDCGTPLRPEDRKCPVCLKEIDIEVVKETVVDAAGKPVVSEETVLIKETVEPPRRNAQVPPTVPPTVPASDAPKGPAVPPTQAKPAEKPAKSGGNGLLLWIIAGILALLLVGGCIWFFVFYTDRAKGSGGRNHDVDDDWDATEKVDGVGRGSDKKGVDITPDLVFNELNGPVKLATYYTDYGYGPYMQKELFFSNKGEWVNVPTWQGDEKNQFSGVADKYEKDSSGYIVRAHEIEYSEGDEGSPADITYIWENGRLAQRISKTEDNGYDYYYNTETTTNFEYDEKGNVTKESSYTTINSSWDTSNSTKDLIYSYISFDDFGNWTSRQVTSRSRWNGGDTYTDTYTERREILYY